MFGKKVKKDKNVIENVEPEIVEPPIIEKVTQNAISNEIQNIEQEETEKTLIELIDKFIALSKEDRQKALKLIRVNMERRKYGKKC